MYRNPVMRRYVTLRIEDGENERRKTCNEELRNNDENVLDALLLQWEFQWAFEESTGQLTRIIPAFALKLPPPCTLPPVRFSYAPPFTRYSLPLATPLISNLLTCIWEFLNILPRSSVLSTSSFSPSLSDASLWMKIVLSSVSMSQSRLVRGRRRLVRVSANWMAAPSSFEGSARIAVAS